MTILNLAPSRDSCVSGTVRITDTPSGIEVGVDEQSLPTQPATEYIAHVHESGTCAEDRLGNSVLIVYGLDLLYTNEDGTALSATSLVGITLGQLFSDPSKYINLHAEPIGEEVPPGIACADLSLRGE